MKYEIALNSETMNVKYVKVPFGRGQTIITYKKNIVPKELYDKLFKTQYNNFIFYEDDVRRGREIKWKPEEKTILTGTIKEKKVIKKRGIKKLIDKLL